MTRSLLAVCLFLLVLACGGGTDIMRRDSKVDAWVEQQRRAEAARKRQPCSDDWYQAVETKIQISDEQGHGPDLGSGEWQSALEFRLGVRDDQEFPEMGSASWCERTDSLVFQP